MPLEILGKKYLTAREIAAETKLNYRTILRYIKMRKIASRRLGNKSIIELSEFNDFMSKTGLN